MGSIVSSKNLGCFKGVRFRLAIFLSNLDHFEWFWNHMLSLCDFAQETGFFCIFLKNVQKMVKKAWVIWTKMFWLIKMVKKAWVIWTKNICFKKMVKKAWVIWTKIFCCKKMVKKAWVIWTKIFFFKKMVKKAWVFWTKNICCEKMVKKAWVIRTKIFRLLSPEQSLRNLVRKAWVIWTKVIRRTKCSKFWSEKRE